MKESEKMNKRMIISVFPLNNIINKENIDIIKSKDIIYPICKKLCKYFIDNYKIRFYQNKNGHPIDNIKLYEFNNTQ